MKHENHAALVRVAEILEGPDGLLDALERYMEGKRWPLVLHGRFAEAAEAIEALAAAPTFTGESVARRLYNDWAKYLDAPQVGAAWENLPDGAKEWWIGVALSALREAGVQDDA